MWNLEFKEWWNILAEQRRYCRIEKEGILSDVVSQRSPVVDRIMPRLLLLEPMKVGTLYSIRDTEDVP